MTTAEEGRGEREMSPLELADGLEELIPIGHSEPIVRRTAVVLRSQATEIERLHRLLADASRDWAEGDTVIRTLARPVLGDAAVGGDTHGVPPVEDIVARLVAEIVRLKEESRQWEEESLLALVTWRRKVKAEWKRVANGHGWLSCVDVHDMRCLKAMITEGVKCECGADDFRRLMED